MAVRNLTRLVWIFVSVFYLIVENGAFNGQFPMRKTWWAKQITPNIYCAGRLSANQIKYASEDGFQGIILIPYLEADSNLEDEFLPSSVNQKDVAEGLAGLEFTQVMENGETTIDGDTVHKFHTAVEGMKRPVLVQSLTGKVCTFLSLLYLANQTASDGTAVPFIDSAALYHKVAALGYDITTIPGATALVAQITGELEVTNPEKPDVTLKNWDKAWMVKPVFKNWFVSGQIQTNQLGLLREAGFTAIINSRKGNTIPSSGSPSQEEVNLLNVKGRVGTYTDGGRQLKAVLEKNRIDSTKPNSYIDGTSQVNYQSANPLEFGDHIGYNEEIVEDLIKKAGFEYANTPIGGDYTYNTAMFDHHSKVWLSFDDHQLLMQCRTAYRSIVGTLLSVGHKYKKTSQWALDTAKIHGYHYEGQAAIVELFQEVLDNNQNNTSSEIDKNQNNTSSDIDENPYNQSSAIQALWGNVFMLLLITFYLSL